MNIFRRVTAFLLAAVLLLCMMQPFGFGALTAHAEEADGIVSAAPAGDAVAAPIGDAPAAEAAAPTSDAQTDASGLAQDDAKADAKDDAKTDAAVDAKKDDAQDDAKKDDAQDDAKKKDDASDEVDKTKLPSYVFRSSRAVLSQVLEALEIKLTQNVYHVHADTDCLTLSTDTFNLKRLSRVALTAELPFADAVLTVESVNGKDVHQLLLSYDPNHTLLMQQMVETTLDDAEFTLVGRMPEEADVDVEKIEIPAEVEVNNAIGFDITVCDGFEPETPIELSIRDPRICQMHENDMQIVVIHEAEDGTLEPIKPEVQPDGTLVFEAEHFSPFYVGGYLMKSIMEWTVGSFTCSLWGAESLQAERINQPVVVEEGLEVLGAWSFRVSGLLSDVSDQWLAVTPGEAELPDARETTDLYTLEGGELGTLLAGRILTEADAALGETQSFALVRDSGFRLKQLSRDPVHLDGWMPKDASASILNMQTSSEVAALKSKVLAAYDIAIIDNGKEYEPSEEKPITVSIDVPNIAEADLEELAVWHLLDDGTAEQIEDFTVTSTGVTFPASGFSVYAVTAGAYHRTYRFFTLDENDMYVEYVLYTDLGSTTYTQTVKDGEPLVIPQLPALPDSEHSTFSGWFEGTTASPTPPIDPADVVLSNTEFDFNNLPPITSDDEEVYLFAKFAEFTFVIFHDQYNGSTHSFPIAMDRRGELVGSSAAATIQINDFTITYDDDSTENSAPSMAFYGWSYTPISEAGSEYDDYGDPVSRIEEDELTITDPVHLYPIFRPIHWLSYYSGPTGSGATYIPAAYYYESEGPSSLQVPLRSGYAFDGWFTGSVDENDNVTYGVRITEEDGSLVQNANDAANGVRVQHGWLALSRNATLYAKWVVATVNYTVVIWRQEASDSPGLSDSEKSYDYAESIVLEDTTGATVTVDDMYKSFGGVDDYFGFTYSRCDAAQVVRGNGSTVLNVYYDRNAWTLRFQSANGGTTYRTINELYGHNIEDYFPITATNGTTYTAARWKPQSNTLGWTEVMTRIQYMPNGNVNFRLDGANSNYPTKTMYYYVEGKEGDPDAVLVDGIYFIPYGNPVQARYNGVTEEDFVDIAGFERYKWTDANGNSNPYSSTFYIYSTSQNQSIYFYYKRIVLQVSLLDSYTNTYAFVGGASDSDQLSDLSIPFGWDINDYLPGTPTPVQIAGGETLFRNGYSFTGWYTDMACSTRVFFEDNEEYRNYRYGKVLYSSMPAYNLRFYAGWETIWYKVTIDPNYGWLNNGNGSGSTWFWEPYNGDPIQEYTWVRRDYVEAANGTFFYHFDDRSARWGEEWTSEEDNDHERYAYYTTNQAQATDQSRLFRFAENAYRYAGWYEVNAETGEETLYNFGAPVTHDTHLVLHWKRITTYHVNYNTVVTVDGQTVSGTLDGGDHNETLFHELDEDEYVDSAEVVITRTAIAPEGYNFIGWSIRGDPSGEVYTPGHPFVFHSTYAVTMPQGETIYLDAVFTRIPTAKIIYDANGGTLADGADLGGMAQAGASTPSIEYDTEAGTGTIANLIVNGNVRLSNGTGFSMPNAILSGWNTEPDASGTHYDLNSTAYRVDLAEPVRLYAEWKVKVFYHLNASASNATFGTTWDPNVYTREATDIYSQLIYMHRTVDQPVNDPVYTGTEDLTFHYWGTMRYAGDNISRYEFSTPVDGELHLYAYWAGPIEVPIHAVDASAREMEEVSEWRNYDMVKIYSGPGVAVGTASDAEVYISAPDDPPYVYAFTAIKSSTAPLEDLSTANAVASVYYNSPMHCVYVSFVDSSRPDEPLADEDELYFVYYRDPISIPISYKRMDTTGALADATMARSGYPTSASVGSYVIDASGSVDRPLYWANQSTYKHFAYAIGEVDAFSASQLRIITDSSGTDNTRPPLQVQNTWRGVAYSTDGGTTWTSVGYDGEISIYVVYFETDQKPANVTIREQTVGTAEDMQKAFYYTAVVQTKLTTTRSTEYATRSGGLLSGYTYTTVQITPNSTTTVDSGDPFQFSFELADGQSQTVALMRESSTQNSSWSTGRTNITVNGTTYRCYTRTVTTEASEQYLSVTQDEGTTVSRGFTNEVLSANGTISPYAWDYNTSENAQTPSATFKNTHTPLTVTVHLAMAENGGVLLRDSLRVGQTTITLPLGEEAVFLSEISSSSLFSDPSGTYGFGGVFYGSMADDTDGSAVTLVDSASSVHYERAEPPDGNLCYFYLDSDTDLSLDNYEIFYLYYPIPHVQYVKETAGGSLEKIVPNGQTPLNANETLTLNGTTVTQNQTLTVGTETFTITQQTAGTATNGYFNMPLVLDDTTVSPSEQSFLRYMKLGVGGADAARSSDLTLFANRQLLLKVDGGQVKWSADGTTWQSFIGAPTVYAIYSEIGYTLNLHKTVTGDGRDLTKSFRLTILSPSITETHYSVTGTGYPTISAQPATGSASGRIELTVSHDSAISISGLARGTYTIQEDGREAELHATVDGAAQRVTDNEFSFQLSSNAAVELENVMYAIAPTNYVSPTMPYWHILIFGGLLGLPAAMLHLRRQGFRFSAARRRRRRATASTGDFVSTDYIDHNKKAKKDGNNERRNPMKRTIKTILATLLSVLILCSICLPAMAVEDMSSANGVIGAFTNTPTTKDTSVIIYKEITAFNHETCTVNAPAITYTYTIGAGAAGSDIYDASSHHSSGANAHVVTKAGIGTPTITGTAAGQLALVPGTNTLNASENGTANRFPLTVSFTGINFAPDSVPAGQEALYGAGVYRYVITETTTEATKNASGITEGTGANTLYMDVYVDGSGNIYGYVLFTVNDDIDARPDADATAASAAGKVEGFVDTDADSTDDVTTADAYYTFNFELKKTVENDPFIAQTQHQFPFNVTLANTNVTANILPIMTITGNATQTALTAGTISTTWTPTIADNSVISYVGIPCGTTVQIYETNDVAGTTYSTSSQNADTNAATKSVYTNDVSNTATLNGTSFLTAATTNYTAGDSKQITFVNELLIISPTGVVMRIAPYALILAAGIVLMVLVLRRRKAEENA